jgi:hypothetical protein
MHITLDIPYITDSWSNINKRESKVRLVTLYYLIGNASTELTTKVCIYVT